MVIIVVILAAALVGAVGFIAWDKLAKNNTDTDTTAGTSQSATGEETIKETNEAPEPVLSLGEWDVEVPLKENSTKFILTYRTYTTDDGRGGSLYDVTSSDSTCNDVASHGGLARYDANHEGPLGIWRDSGAGVTIGDYTYVYSGPQAACSDDEAVMAQVQKQRDEFKELAQGIRRAGE